MAAQVPLRSPRGCLTCKQRRKKCDETRPTCQRCVTGNFRCLGYSHLDAPKASGSKPWDKRSKTPETPLFSYEPIRTLSKVHESSERTSSRMDSSQSPPGRGSEEEQRPSNAVVSRRTRGGLDEIPRMLELNPAHIDAVVQLVISQLSRLEYRVFSPLSVEVQNTIIRRVNLCDMMRWSMFLGAQITQMLLDGKGRKNYVDLIRRFHRQIVGPSSVSTPDSDIRMRLRVSLDLALYAFMVSDSATCYSLFKSCTPLFLHYATKFPEVWSGSSTISLVHALRAPQFEIARFVFWDVVCALLLGIPSVFQYDTASHSSEKSNRPALEWVYGCPEEIVILIARINASRGPRSSRNPGPSPYEWREIEMRLQQWTPRLEYVGGEPSHFIARFAVQESWRHAVLVYLYMGMCGADSSDRRVEAAVRQIAQLSSTIEEGNPVGLHLFVPCLIAGVASRQEKQRDALRQRVHASKDTSSWVLRGADFAVVLDHLWHGAARGGRPTRWEDYVQSRCAALPVES